MSDADDLFNETIKTSPYLWVKRRKDNPNMAYYLHWCQGCKHAHTYPTGGILQDHNWNFNGSIERPSFTPSMRIFIPAGPYGENEEQVPERTICHYYVTDGQIAYCGDSDHQYKGQTLPLEPIPDDYGF